MAPICIDPEDFGFKHGVQSDPLHRVGAHPRLKVRGELASAPKGAKRMKFQSTRERLLASTIVCGAMVLAAPALAQTAPSPTSPPAAGAAQPDQGQVVVVTGSRIPQPNLTSVSPITAVSSQTVKLEGTTSAEDLINQLPQASGDFGSYESNGSTGTATIDLRGLGNSRTLVLVNGVRLQAGDPTGGAATGSPGGSTGEAADINMIPPALIDRVDVLTGGASAVYGSDAIAGVVNFILKTHFQGLQIDEETSIAQDGGGNSQVRAADANSVSALGFSPIQFPGNTWDGLRQTVTVIGGASSGDGKASGEFYMGYTYIQPVLQSQRDYSKCSIATDNTSTKFQYCGGSAGTPPTGRLTPLTGNPATAGQSFDILEAPVGGLLPAFSNGDAFNYAPFNYFQRPDQRYTAGEFSDYQFNSMFDVYSSFMFMDDHSVAQEAPGGSFYTDDIFNIPCNDPLLSAAQANTLCGANAGTTNVATAEIGRRDVEGGNRIQDLEHMDYRLTLGVKGDLGDGWTYDLLGLYGRSVLTESQDGFFVNSNLIDSIDIVPGPNGPVCASGASGCVPYNIWSPGGVTKAALGYLIGNANNSGATTEQIVSFNVANSDLSKYGLKLPAATDGIGVAFGLEYRAEGLETQYDQLIANAELSGFGGAIKNTSGEQIDDDIFGELRVPLIQDAPGFKDLTLELGDRFADYSHGGGTNSYKIGLDWQTIPDIRLRASYDQAQRAPNVQDLFQPAVPNLAAGSDGCATGLGGEPPVLSPAQCLNTFQHSAPGITLNQLINGGYTLNGVTYPAFYGSVPQCPSAQCGDFAGGNPNLKPEVATTYTFGVVFTPTFFRNFTLSVDYWNISIAKAILNFPLTTIVSNCGILDNAYDCAQINRFLPGGASIFGGEGLGSVNLPLVNAGSLKTSGVDIEGTYRFSLDDVHMEGWGSVAFDFNGTYTDEVAIQLPDGTGYNCIGLYGVTCGIPSPTWRHTLRTTWITPWNLSLSLNWRYIAGTALDFNTSQPDLQDGNFKDLTATDAHIPAYNYLDFAFTWRVKDGFSVRGGVNNLFDKAPPLLDSNSFGISAPPFGNGNTYPETYDPLGRVFFLGLTADF
jgi:iron complex outermembrane receptor protein